MTRVLLWLAVTYCAFKFAGMVLARGPGFRPSEIGFQYRLRAGEPGLFLAALMVSAPLALLMSSYSKRTYTGVYTNAVTCYGRITALMPLPEVSRNVDGFTLYDSVRGYRTSALRTGADLEMKPGEVIRALAASRAGFTRAYFAQQRWGMRQGMDGEVAMALRCLHPRVDAANA